MFCKEEVPILLTILTASCYLHFYLLHTFGYAVIHYSLFETADIFHMLNSSKSLSFKLVTGRRNKFPGKPSIFSVRKNICLMRKSYANLKYLTFATI